MEPLTIEHLRTRAVAELRNDEPKARITIEYDNLRLKVSLDETEIRQLINWLDQSLNHLEDYHRGTT